MSRKEQNAECPAQKFEPLVTSLFLELFIVTISESKQSTKYYFIVSSRKKCILGHSMLWAVVLCQVSVSGCKKNKKLD